MMITRSRYSKSLTAENIDYWSFWSLDVYEADPGHPSGIPRPAMTIRKYVPQAGVEPKIIYHTAPTTELIEWVWDELEHFVPDLHCSIEEMEDIKIRVLETI